MLRKNQKPFYFTEEQEKQLETNNLGLRKLNRIAREELRRIGHIGITPRQYREAGESLGMLATRMNSALRFRQEIPRAGRQQQPDRVVIHFSTLCDCPESRRLREHKEDKNACEALKPDLAHLAEIDALLALTSRIEELVSYRSTLRGSQLNAFFRQISRFGLAVLKQQQHLQAAVPQQELQIEFQDEDPNGLNICPHCHQSTDIADTMEGYDRSTEGQY